MGDTQSFVSLAGRFKQQGHMVKLAARPDFAGLAASYGIEFAPLGNPYKSLLRSEEVATARRRNSSSDIRHCDASTRFRSRREDSS